MTGPEPTPAEEAREAVVTAALRALDLDARTRLPAWQDMWSLPALGLVSLVIADAPAEPAPDRPARRLAAFPSVAAGPRETAEAAVELPRRAFEVWDDTTNAWAYVKGSYEISAGRSITDRRLTAPINV